MFPAISPNGENGHKSILIFAVKRRLAPIARQHLSFRFSPPTPGIHLNIVATSDAQRDKEIALSAGARQRNDEMTVKLRWGCASKRRGREDGRGWWGRGGEGQGNEKIRWHSHFVAAVSSRGKGREEKQSLHAFRGQQRGKWKERDATRNSKRLHLRERRGQKRLHRSFAAAAPAQGARKHHEMTVDVAAARPAQVEGEKGENLEEKGQGGRNNYEIIAIAVPMQGEQNNKDCT